MNIHNKISENPFEIANHFNDYFIKVGSPAQGTHEPPGHPVATPMDRSIFIHPTDPREIHSIIHKLKNKCSCGFDEIPPVFVKTCAKELASPLSLLINQSFTEGVVPDFLKITIIKPLFKKDDKMDCNNYCPIALASLHFYNI